MTQTPVVEAHGLTKRFGKTPALAGLDLTVHHGRVAALLGPNGAGKTTFIRAVATLVRPDGGSLRVAGFDAVRQPADVRRVIGLAGQYAAVEEAMTGRENLEMVARLFGLDRTSARQAATTVLDQLGLGDDAERLARTYSRGMRRRLDLGASLVGSPRRTLPDRRTAGRSVARAQHCSLRRALAGVVSGDRGGVRAPGHRPLLPPVRRRRSARRTGAPREG